MSRPIDERNSKLLFGIYFNKESNEVNNDMGNGASGPATEHTISLVDGEKVEVAKVKLLYPEMKNDLQKKDAILQEKDEYIKQLTNENTALKTEIRQLKSVLDQTRNGVKAISDVIPEDGQAKAGLGRADSKNKFTAIVDKVRSKRFAVSAESGKLSTTDEKELPRFPKDSEAKALIQKGIRNNNFLKHLDDSQVNEIISYMYNRKVKQNEYVVKEGDSGNALFVLKSGSLEVSKGGEVLGRPLKVGTLFGELALLYNCTRTASVKALEDVEVWTIQRSVYQSVMRKTGTMRREEHQLFLKSVPVFKGFQNEKLCKVADVCSEEFYAESEYIVREGERGDSFFVILEGVVRVMQMIEGQEEPQQIRKLTRGDYFGEKALLSEDMRTASIIAEKPGVKCLTIERDTFMRFIGTVKQIAEKDYGDCERKAVHATQSVVGSTKSETVTSLIRPEYRNATIDQYSVLATLGMGGFGRVELVQDKHHPEKTYALKSLSKRHIVETKQQEHIYNEKNILLSLDSNFIIKLYRSFRDNKFVYLLTEVCLGGELWTILRDRDTFDETTSRFYIGCVVEALEYLHTRGVVYRDLKPENLLVDAQGYGKLVDFGFAKMIGSGKKTWTFCGTPEYVAPEIILNKGHDVSSDYWSLGILIFELMTGNPPFSAGDAMSTYNIILKGIDVLEFPDIVTRNAQSLIKRLCRENPSERLGNQKDGLNDVRKHKWFHGFHWAGLVGRTLKAPLKPKIKSPTDSSNFDYFSSKRDLPPDELSGWDRDF